MFRPFVVLAAVLGTLTGAARTASAQQLSEQKLAEIKRATVLVKVSNGSIGGSGSGFLVRVADKTTGYVVTNHHVIDLKSGRKTHRRPGEPWDEYIEVVFHSGTPDEIVRQAEVVAEDPERDLAVLKVSTGRELPRPFDLTSPPRVMETLPVLVCGFPYGGLLSTNARNPTVTIGKATVSSIRTNNAGDPVYIQLDGEVNPGNSGGPIVTAEGNLVGVAVMAINGAGIGLAIPHQEVAAMLTGRLGAAALFAAPVDRDTVQLKIDVPLIDPFRAVGTVRAYYKLADTGATPPRADKSGRWVKLSGAVPVELALKNGWAGSAVRLPRDGKPSLWLQLEFTTRSGTTYLLGTTEHTLPAFKPTDGPANGVHLTANRVGLDDKIGAKGGGVGLRELHSRPERFIGTKVTLDVAVSGDVKRGGSQPELTVLFDKNTKAGNLRFVAAESLAAQVEKAVAKDGPPATARVVGTVYAPDGTEKRCTVELEEVRLLGPDGSVTASLKPVATVAAAPKPEAKPATPAAPAAEPAAEAPPAEAGALPGNIPIPVAAAGAAGLLMGGIGLGLLVARRAARAATAPPPAQPPAPTASSVPPPVEETPLPGAGRTDSTAKRPPARRVRF